ncbi:MAG: FAD-dependent oxidoreductase [Gemmatimonadota bacterium]
MAGNVGGGDTSAAASVAIVGAGPVGLALALALARQGVRSVVVERNASTSEHSKAAAVHLRTREVFRQWGIENRFLEAGILRTRLKLHDAGSGDDSLISLDFGELESEADRPGMLFIEQSRTEALLLEAVRKSGMCDVRFGAEVVGIDPGDTAVVLKVRQDGEPRRLETAFVVGCDGAGSFVRDALGLPFEGSTYSLRPMLADVHVRDERDALPWPRARNSPDGLAFTFRLRPGLWRLIRLEARDAGTGAEVRPEALDRVVADLLGPGEVEVVWASRFRIHRRASPRFRVGRVLLAGDAAHVHSPAGGQGMNAGIQDAHNLAWKLAYALRGGDVDRLLDSYDAERREVVVQEVSRYTDFVTRSALQAPTFLRGAVFALWRAAIRIPRIRRTVLRRATMIDLDYSASPLIDAGLRAAGVRLPNPALHSPAGTIVRLYDLLPEGPVIIEVGGGGEDGPAGLPLENVIRIGPGDYLDKTGAIAGLIGGPRGWVLVRPDAHVAWATTDPEGIHDAVTRALGSESVGS